MMASSVDYGRARFWGSVLTVECESKIIHDGLLWPRRLRQGVTPCCGCGLSEFQSSSALASVTVV